MARALSARDSRLLGNLGRPVRLSDMHPLAAPTPGDDVLVLRMRIAQDLLRPGIHTLSAWVTDGSGGRRTSVRSSFVVEEAPRPVAKPPEPKPGAKPLPVPLRRPMAVVPAPPRHMGKLSALAAATPLQPAAVAAPSGKIDRLAEPLGLAARMRRPAPGLAPRGLPPAARVQVQNLQAHTERLLKLRNAIAVPEAPPAKAPAGARKRKTK